MNLMFNNKKIDTPSMAAKLSNLPSTPHLPDEDDMPTPSYEQPDDGSSRKAMFRKIALGVSVLAVVGTVAAVALNETQEVARGTASFGSAVSTSVGPQHNNQGAPSDFARFAELDSLADIYKLRLQLDAEEAPHRGNQAPPANEGQLAHDNSMNDFANLAGRGNQHPEEPKRVGIHYGHVRRHHDATASPPADGPQRGNQAPPADELSEAQVDSIRDIENLHAQLAGKAPQRGNQAPPADELSEAQVDSIRDIENLHAQLAGKAPQRGNQAPPADELSEAQVESVVGVQDDTAPQGGDQVPEVDLAELDQVLKVLNELNQHNSRHRRTPN
ncbi:hypothetical protein H257_02277 [Aphanomyces astaci]|uniref:Transmembrane protein n=1 Tax=Aphanomyces astaci TaxID=112090 RepID=W4H262_APHAT|nr:hypothetical protein H257_02277 [Aphanomyces astaci]ETV85666.1 hypothetical protein H257_02277 [Aphanomyces astaci]|eukprot:XP_009824138.1 hypothetical protein H257_02277 [Aphanomyces astaci]